MSPGGACKARRMSSANCLEGLRSPASILKIVTRDNLPVPARSGWVRSTPYDAAFTQRPKEVDWSITSASIFG